MVVCQQKTNIIKQSNLFCNFYGCHRTVKLGSWRNWLYAYIEYFKMVKLRYRYISLAGSIPALSTTLRLLTNNRGFLWFLWFLWVVIEILPPYYSLTKNYSYIKLNIMAKNAIVTKVKTGKLIGQFRFKLLAKNGKVIAQSYPETYHNKKDCIKTLKNNFADFEINDETTK